MRIGLDVSNVVTRMRTGVSRYTIELVSALAGQVEAQDRLTLFYKLSRWRHWQDWPSCWLDTTDLLQKLVAPQ
jgi:hypothetical protein